MAIAFLGQLTANSASAASLAFANTNYTAGLAVIAVALGSTSVSVSSITATGAGSFGTPTLRAAINGTGVRIEVWTVTVSGTLTITVNLSGTTSICQCLSEYSGVTSVGNTATNSRTDNNAYPGSVTLQDSSNFVVGCYAWNYSSGDSLSFAFANSRSAVGNAAGAIVSWIADASTSLSGQSATVWASISNTSGAISARNSAMACIELRSGIATSTATSYASSSAPSMQVARDFRVLNVTMPQFCQGQLYPASPPTPTVNSGFVG